MVNETKIIKEMLIGEVVNVFPAAAEVLFNEGVHCVGCGAANHESIEQGLSAHGKDEKEVDDIVKKMNKAVVEAKKNANTVIITKIAAKKVKELMAKDKKTGLGLRITVTPGGCSGFQYGLDFGKKKKDDNIFESEGVQIFVDKKSFVFLKGSKVDFIDGPHGSGFTIMNPNIASGCSCGCGE